MNSHTKSLPVGGVENPPAVPLISVFHIFNPMVSVVVIFLALEISILNYPT